MRLRNLQVVLLMTLLVLLPFHTFLVTAVKEAFFDPLGAPPAIISAWKEIILFLLGANYLFLLITKKIPFPKFDELDLVIFLYMGWSLATGFWRWETDIMRTLWGAKYSLFFLIIFLLVRHFPYEEAEKKKLFRVTLGAAAIVIFFGLLQKFLPEDFLVSFGYSPYFSEFHPDGPVSYCQKISFTDICRSQSFFSGPNQLSSYLLFTLPLFFFQGFHYFSKEKEKRKSASERAFGVTFFLSGLVLLFFAYSRASWGGMLVGLGIAFLLLFYREKWFKKLFITGIAAVFGILLFGFLSIPSPYGATCAPYGSFQEIEQTQDDNLPTNFFCRVIYRPSSSQSHFERSRDGVKHIMMHPFGTGLGDSGPASARFYKNGIGFIPESWFLQVGIDTGFPGLILFLMILFLLGKKLLQTKTWEGQALLCGLVGISVMALKLHSWESADTAYVFWALCGVVLATRAKESWWRKIKERLFQNARS